MSIEYPEKGFPPSDELLLFWASDAFESVRSELKSAIAIRAKWILQRDGFAATRIQYEQVRERKSDRKVPGNHDYTLAMKIATEQIFSEWRNSNALPFSGAQEKIA